MADKIRITHQREIILDQLKTLKTHPTADELFELVRVRLPRVSLATVYRNLEWLCQQGIVQKIEVGGRQKRFDGTVDLHYHIRCISCGRVDDVDMIPVDMLEQDLSKKSGYSIRGHRLEFWGTCPACTKSVAS
jgi:Fur family transcriptional regulator, ferric uptake regulator